MLLPRLVNFELPALYANTDGIENFNNSITWLIRLKLKCGKVIYRGRVDVKIRPIQSFLFFNTLKTYILYFFRAVAAGGVVVD